jgi:hypothetical protein
LDPEVGHRRRHQPSIRDEKLMPELFDWADEDSDGHLTKDELTCLFEPAFCPSRDGSFRIWAVSKSVALVPNLGS